MTITIPWRLYHEEARCSCTCVRRSTSNAVSLGEDGEEGEKMEKKSQKVEKKGEKVENKMEKKEQK